MAHEPKGGDCYGTYQCQRTHPPADFAGVRSIISGKRIQKDNHDRNIAGKQCVKQQLSKHMYELLNMPESLIPYHS